MTDHDTTDTERAIREAHAESAGDVERLRARVAELEAEVPGEPSTRRAAQAAGWREGETTIAAFVEQLAAERDRLAAENAALREAAIAWVRWAYHALSCEGWEDAPNAEEVRDMLSDVLANMGAHPVDDETQPPWPPPRSVETPATDAAVRALKARAVRNCAAEVLVAERAKSDAFAARLAVVTEAARAHLAEAQARGHDPEFCSRARLLTDAIASGFDFEEASRAARRSYFDATGAIEMKPMRNALTAALRAGARGAT